MVSARDIYKLFATYEMSITQEDIDLRGKGFAFSYEYYADLARKIAARYPDEPDATKAIEKYGLIFRTDEFTGNLLKREYYQLENKDISEGLITLLNILKEGPEYVRDAHGHIIPSNIERVYGNTHVVNPFLVKRIYSVRKGRLYCNGVIKYEDAVPFASASLKGGRRGKEPMIVGERLPEPHPLIASITYNHRHVPKILSSGKGVELAARTDLCDSSSYPQILLRNYIRITYAKLTKPSVVNYDIHDLPVLVTGTEDRKPIRRDIIEYEELCFEESKTIGEYLKNVLYPMAWIASPWLPYTRFANKENPFESVDLTKMNKTPIFFIPEVVAMKKDSINNFKQIFANTLQICVSKIYDEYARYWFSHRTSVSYTYNYSSIKKVMNEMTAVKQNGEVEWQLERLDPITSFVVDDGYVALCKGGKVWHGTIENVLKTIVKDNIPRDIILQITQEHASQVSKILLDNQQHIKEVCYSDTPMPTPALGTGIGASVKQSTVKKTKK